MTRQALYTLLMAVVTAGCTETERPDVDRPVRNEGYTLFSATTETLFLAADGGDPFERIWSQGDYIGLFASEQGENTRYTLKRAGYGTSMAEFYGPQVIGEHIAAYYPYDAALQGEAGAIPLTLEPVQCHEGGLSAIARFLTYCPRIFAGLDDPGQLTFGYPLGMLAVQIHFDEPITVTGMTLASSSRALGGAGTVDEELALTMAEAATPTLTLDCGAGMPSETETPEQGGTEYTSFCFVLPPAEYAAGDLTLEIQAREQQPIRCTLRKIVVRRISSCDCSLTTAIVSARPDGEFDTETGYLEGSVLFGPRLPNFDSETGYLEPQPEVPEIETGTFETEEGYLDEPYQNSERP